MTPVLISVIIILACLVLGAIGVGIYIAVFRSKPENKGKDFSSATVWLIMVTSLLLGILLVVSYFLYTGRECPECNWGSRDVEALKGAQTTFDVLQRKVDVIPRNMSYTTSCDADPSGGACGVKVKSPPK
jgi:hypothetical protein